MYKELREKAEKRVQAKLNFYTVLITFSFVSLLLVILSMYLVDIAFWLMLPIPVFAMVLGILYISTFGYSINQPPNVDWKETEIEKELMKLYQKKKAQLPPLEELSETEMLELRELERMQRKLDGTDDLV